MTDCLTPYQLMEKLVSFNTVSSVSNLPLIDWVEEYLNSHGITGHRHYDDTSEKASLFAHVGPKIAGGVVLSGHTDVVPVEGQPWASDPFTVVERDGKYFGRGTCDMKGFDGLAIWALVEASKRDLTRPLQLALSYDEEIGCLGAPPMIEAMQMMLPKASVVIVGEPSMMTAVTGHKGGGGFQVHVRGFEVHSSLMHTGVNAIMAAAKLIEWGNQMNAANMARPASQVDAPFEPPWTTLHVGTIAGGTAHNITALDCHLRFDFRVVPGESLAKWKELFRAKVTEVEAEMQAVQPSAHIALEEFFTIPGLVPEKDGEAETFVRRITGDNGCHVVSYGTEAGQFQQAGYSAVICGPGNIAQAHQPDEYLSVAQFNAGHDFIKRLLDNLSL